MKHPDAVDLIDSITRASNEIRNPFPNVRFWHFHDGVEYELIRVFADDNEVHFDLVERKDNG